MACRCAEDSNDAMQQSDPDPQKNARAIGRRMRGCEVGSHNDQRDTLRPHGEERAFARVSNHEWLVSKLAAILRGSLCSHLRMTAELLAAWLGAANAKRRVPFLERGVWCF